MKNLKQVGLALRSYHDQYGCLPPPCLYDASGRAMHSWRVLILPFLGCESLYKQYDFSEPWDGPNNRRLLEARPSVYACPADKTALARGSTSTSYVAVVGAKAAWQRDKMTRLNAPDLRDNLDTTVLIIERSSSGIQWTEPKDLSLDHLHPSQLDSALILHSPHTHSIGYFYYDTPLGANVALANGGTHFLLVGDVGDVPVDTLEGLLAIGGFTGKNIAAYSSGDEKGLHVNWPKCLSLPVWVAVVGLLLYQAVRGRGQLLTVDNRTWPKEEGAAAGSKGKKRKKRKKR